MPSRPLPTTNTPTTTQRRQPQAAKDIVVRVPVLSGQEVRLPVKANAVPRSGLLTLREKGHGMPKKSGGYGDLVVELSVAPSSGPGPGGKAGGGGRG